MKLPKGTLEKLWSDPVHWRGPFYYCKDDPRNVVPKRVTQTGWTINFAHPSAWIGLLVRLALMVGVLSYLKSTGQSDWMFALIAAIVIFSIWDGRRKSSPNQYEENE
jgi:hypothetical protein